MRAANDEPTTGTSEANPIFVIGQCMATVFKAISTEPIQARSAAFGLGLLQDAYGSPQCHDDDRRAVHEFLEGFKAGFVEGTFDD